MFLVKLKIAQMRRSDRSNDPNYEFVDAVVPANHEDKTNYKNLSTFGLKTGKDFNYVRDEMKVLLIADTGFANVSEDTDKKILAIWGLCTEAEALTVGITADEYDSYIDAVLDNTKKARGLRVERTRKDFGREIVKGTMTYGESDQLHADSKDLFEAWADANNQLFIDWINSAGNYVGAGFMEKTYGTQVRKDKMIDRIINGNI